MECLDDRDIKEVAGKSQSLSIISSHGSGKQHEETKMWSCGGPRAGYTMAMGQLESQVRRPAELGSLLVIMDTAQNTL